MNSGRLHGAPDPGWWVTHFQRATAMPARLIYCKTIVVTLSADVTQQVVAAYGRETAGEWAALMYAHNYIA